eukprot:Colp12_sorted_trinity150504_noHs@3847
MSLFSNHHKLDFVDSVADQIHCVVVVQQSAAVDGLNSIIDPQTSCLCWVFFLVRHRAEALDDHVAGGAVVHDHQADAELADGHGELQLAVCRHIDLLRRLLLRRAVALRVSLKSSSSGGLGGSGGLQGGVVLGVGVGLGANSVQAREGDHQAVTQALSVRFVRGQGRIFHEESLHFLVVAQELVHFVLQTRRQVAQQIGVGHHAAVVDEALGGEVPVGLHDLRHVCGAGLRGHRVRRLVPVADAGVYFLFRGPVVAGVALLEHPLHGRLEAVVAQLVDPLGQEHVQREGVLLLVQDVLQLGARLLGHGGQRPLGDRLDALAQARVLHKQDLRQLHGHVQRDGVHVLHELLHGLLPQVDVLRHAHEEGLLGHEAGQLPAAQLLDLSGQVLDEVRVFAARCGVGDLSLEDLELLDDGVVHAQLGVAHQHAVPVLSADAVRQVAEVLLCDGDEELLSVGAGLGRGVGLGHGPQLRAHLVQLFLHDLLHGNQLLLDLGDKHSGELLREVLHAVQVGVAVAEHGVRREEGQLMYSALI